MRRFLLLFVFCLSLVIFLSVAINAEKAKETKKSTLDFGLSCDECHTTAEEYPTHLNGYSYCEDCHGSDVHPIHSFDCKTCHQNDPLTPFCHGAPPDVLVPTAKGLVCKACHENNLVSVHEANCQLCHQNVNEIHKKADIAGGVSDV